MMMMPAPLGIVVMLMGCASSQAWTTDKAVKALTDLTSGADAAHCVHLPGTYPHAEWQGTRLEGFVIAQVGASLLACSMYGSVMMSVIARLVPRDWNCCCVDGCSSCTCKWKVMTSHATHAIIMRTM